MGSGKSTIGKMLAKEWQWHFIDLDQYIEANVNRTIPEIFKLQGEAHFRQLESESLANILNKEQKEVISLGGGAPCSEKNIQIIKEKSHSIYLKISPKELVIRLMRSANPRPLVLGKSEEELTRYVQLELSHRETYYLQADQVIASDSLQLTDLLTFLPRLE